MCNVLVTLHHLSMFKARKKLETIKKLINLRDFTIKMKRIYVEKCQNSLNILTQILNLLNFTSPNTSWLQNAIETSWSGARTQLCSCKNFSPDDKCEMFHEELLKNCKMSALKNPSMKVVLIKEL